MIKCKKCGSKKYVKNGKAREHQKYLCKECGCNFIKGNRRTTQFKKDYKKIIKKGLDETAFIEVLKLLCSETPLPQKYKDHPLQGNHKGYRDCHIETDWVLIYKVEKEVSLITLQRTGSHSDLFGKNN